MEKLTKRNVEVWGGIECTLNRVKDNYFDQLNYSGHYMRDGDIDLIAAMGVKKMRYPVLWEKHQERPDAVIDWQFAEKSLGKLKTLNIEPIAGLVHHGSGPAFVDMCDNSFAEGLAAYAEQVAVKFPWIKYYTPVNEPLTTARFCGLYGVWYPHKNDMRSFFRILVNECKGTILAMQAIQKINPEAVLVQTEDLGKIHSTPLLQYQADYENDRRWLSLDLLTGKVDERHPLWYHLLAEGIRVEELEWFLNNQSKSIILGFNHYLTSERFLDEGLTKYPPHTHGGNGRQSYADVEAVRVGTCGPDGPYKLLKEAWERYHLPMAVTEVHLHCFREEQMRWLNEVWQAANKLLEEDINVIAITPWAMLGSYGWNRLLTQPGGTYEPGVCDINQGTPRPTAMAEMIKSFSRNTDYQHPVLKNIGWWKHNCRVIYDREHFIPQVVIEGQPVAPLLIIGKTGTLGNAFERVCEYRRITHEVLSRTELDITNKAQIEKVILEKRPWAIINTAGYVRVDDAEINAEDCFLANTNGPENLAILCRKYGVKLLTYSSDLVFNGQKNRPYTESDEKLPLNIYGASKALAEQKVLANDPNALIIRSGAFFGPWDSYNFISQAVEAFKNDRTFKAVNDVSVSHTYVPDLVNKSIDLLLDNERGIWHLSSDGQSTWSELAFAIAERMGNKAHLVVPMPLHKFSYKAARPFYSVLGSEKGLILPSLDDALGRCLFDMAS